MRLFLGLDLKSGGFDLNNKQPPSTIEEMWGVHQIQTPTSRIGYNPDKKALVYGYHVYGNLYDCDPEILKNETLLVQIVKDAATKAQVNVLSIFYYKFSPEGGVSVIAIVAESHIAIHTWPEYRFATVDVYTCGNTANPMVAFEYIAKALNAKRYDVFMSDRSLYST